MGWITRPLMGVIYPVLTLPRLVRLVFVIMSGFGAAAISAKALGQYVVAPTNPFLEFASVFPGQPESAVHAYPFSCSQDYTYGTLEKHCAFRPKDSVISAINLIVYPGTIAQTIFFLRDDTLQVGDLSAWWGTKVVQKYPDRAFLFLPESVILARTTGYRDHSSLFTPVWSVTFVEASAVG